MNATDTMAPTPLSPAARDATRKPSALLREVLDIRGRAQREAAEILSSWRRHITRAEYLPCAKNLAAYLALRHHDLARLQCDLALALGFERLAEVQEEILWLCEAAHVPAIWATQVFERLIKKGRPARAEATDAAMSQRAECVMLNKGPHLVEGVRFLEDVLRRMDRHQSKKCSRLSVLHAWRADQTLTPSQEAGRATM